MLKWSKEELEILRSKYGTIKKRDLMLLLPNRTFASITWQASHLKLKANNNIVLKRLKPWNENFFHTPNEVNSYWGGMIAADGSINNKNNSLFLHQKEIDVLCRFRDIIGSEHKIITKKDNSNCSFICLPSKIIIKHLEENFNIIANKSLILKPPPNLDYKCSLSYIIGLIDGDGSVIKKDNKLILSITGTYDVLNWTSSILNNLCLVRRRKDCKSEIYRLTAYGLKAEKCLNLLYNHNSVKEHRLKRKWDKLNNFRWNI